MLKEVNLQEKLLKQRNRTLKKVATLDWVQQIFEELDNNRLRTLDKINNSDSEGFNRFSVDKVIADNVFHISQIEKICVDYRLRFLDTKYFKGDYPEEVITIINHLEKEHNTELQNFKIVAPSKLFVLKKADDPLLFAPMGNDYYYLVHKWGNDLHPLRKLKVWSFKNVGNLTFTTSILCMLLTIFTSNFMFNGNQSASYNIMLFMFYFKFAVGFILYFGISLGKNFNQYIWQSRYDKVQ